jgi:glutamate synthase domain-containing protein 3
MANLMPTTGARLDAGTRLDAGAPLAAGTRRFDLGVDTLRALNLFLHQHAAAEGISLVYVDNPDGAHSIACGLHAPLDVEINGPVGYYVAGMNQEATVTVHGNAGPGAAENMMSGRVHIHGFASTAAGASAHGGLLVIDGDASLRCGISLKGGDIVVGGSVGSFSAFMAQAGRIVICGDAGDALGDSLYEAVIYVRGKVRSLGADARFEPMTDFDRESLGKLLREAGFSHDPAEFRRIASAKSLYHWHADADQEY